MLIDQLKQVYIDGELEEVDTPQYFPKILRKDFTVALNLQTSGPDPDPILKIFYGCGASVNWDGYCNPEIDELIERQSREGNVARRKELVWEIERKLAEDVARPIIFYPRGATCLAAPRQGVYPDGRTACSTAGAWKTFGSTSSCAKQRRECRMNGKFRTGAAAAVLMALALGGPALAQKPGGVLKLQHFDSPASMSILEESTRAALQPMMGVFNNLVLYDQHVAQNSLAVDRARSGDQVGVERGRQGADLPAAPGRQMA